MRVIRDKLSSLNMFWESLYKQKDYTEELFFQIKIGTYSETEKKDIFCKLFNLLIPQILETIDLLSTVTQERRDLEEYLMDRLRGVMDEIGDFEALRGLEVTDQMEKHLNFVHDWILEVIYDAKDLVKDLEDSDEEYVVHNMEELKV